GSLGVRAEGRLMSANGRPFQTFGGDHLYTTPFEKAAALLESICNNHPFVDGNKRTALVAAAFLLHKHDVEIYVPVEAGESFMLAVAQGQHDARSIARWLEQWA